MKFSFRGIQIAPWLLGFSLLPGAAEAALEKFVDDLPLPPRLTARAGEALTIPMVQAQVKLHRDLPAQPAFTYAGSFPGPTIEVERGQKLIVHWQNKLPTTHILPPPEGGMNEGMPDVRAVVHLHGMATPQVSITDRLHNNDGWPDLWLVPGQEQIAEYPNLQSARTLWYHDHASGDTGRNVAAGLAGMYVIHDPLERSLKLPAGAYEIPILLQTHGVREDGTRYYGRDAGLEFYGNAVTVNGKLWPRLKVEPRKYRFRIVNGANARTFALKIFDDLDGIKDGPPIHQIGSDAGFLADSVTLNDPKDPDSPRLTLGPAERGDVIIDFSGWSGHQLILQNNSLDPGDGEMPIPWLLRFEVTEPLRGADTSVLPKHIREIPRYSPAQASLTRQIKFSRMTMSNGKDMTMLNDAMWKDPVTERPRLGATEIWELVNPLPDTHPFHVHLVDFQVLDRRPFDAKKFEKEGVIRFLGPAEDPDANEMGWKDVVRVPPKMITRIMMQFSPYKGHYVYHCHILEHEDMDMMRPFEVVDP